MFRTINDLNAYTTDRLAPFTDGAPISFSPVSLLPGVDCGSDIFLKLAVRNSIDPQAFGESMVQHLNSKSFSVSHGHLNFFGGNNPEWLLTEEKLQSQPDTKNTLTLCSYAPEIDGKEVHPLWNLRMRSFLLFQAYLLTQFTEKKVFVHFESSSHPISKENFFLVAYKYLRANKVSLSDNEVLALKEKGEVFLHTGAKGISRALYQAYISSERSNAPWLQFRTIERVFFNSPVLPWSSCFIESLEKDNQKLLSSLFYLSCSYQATELDDSVPFNSENANIFWWISQSKQRLKNLLPAASQTISELQFNETERRTAIHIKFLPIYIQEACYRGKLFELTDVLKSLLKFSESRVNHPSTREALRNGTLSAELFYILTGVKRRLELFS